MELIIILLNLFLMLVHKVNLREKKIRDQLKIGGHLESF